MQAHAPDMSAILFSYVPATTRVPGSYVEFDPSRAVSSVGVQPHESLIIAQKVTAGTAAAGVPVLVRSKDDAIVLAGAKSVAAQACAAYKARDTLTPLWLIPLADHGSGVAATGTIEVTGAATAAGATIIYIGGRRVSVFSPAGQTAAEWEIAALAAIALVGDLPVTADTAGTPDGVEFEAINAGTVGNGIRLGLNLNAGDRAVPGLAFTVTQMASGATDPDFATAVTAMGEDQYNTVVASIQTDTELDKVIAELEARWQPPRQIEGVLFGAKAESQANLTTYGNGFNSHVFTCAGFELSALCPLPWEVAARYAAESAKQAQVHPAIGLAGRDLGADVSSAHRGARFKWEERNTLLSDGIATTKAGSDGRMLIEKSITTYQTDSNGLPSTSLQDLQHVRTLASLRFSWRVWMSKYQNALLADDGNEIAGQTVVTPSVGRSEALAWFLEMKDLGYVENYSQFEAELQVVRSTTDDNRLDFMLPPDLINNLLITATKMAFKR